MRRVEVLLGLGLSWISASLNAQAWLGPKGEITVSLSYQASDFKGHLSETGARDAGGSSKSQSLDLGIDYSLTDRLAFSASLPYVATRNGPDPSPVSDRGGNDDGRSHSNWQDYHFELRYNVLSRAVMLTPFAGVVIPTHHYTVFAEAGTGRDLREAQVGIDVGRLLTPKWHQPYAEARVLYAIPERPLGVSTNRVGIDGTLGLFITPSFSIRGMVNWQRTNGGLTSDQVFGSGGPPARNPNLDLELSGSTTGFFVTTISGRDSPPPGPSTRPRTSMPVSSRRSPEGTPISARRSASGSQEL